MKEITNSTNTGGVIVPDEFHDQLQEWLNEAEENRKKWNQAIVEGNAYIIDEDGNKIKV